ncbi:MAG: DUF2752 domain-containing protein [Planctomycetota bacterium]
MYIEKKGKRRPNWWEAYCLFLFIGAAIYIPLSYGWGYHLPSSPTRIFFDFPCPLCGGTRAVTALCLGRFGEAWEYNPMAVLVFVLMAGSIVLWLVALFTRRRIAIDATKKQGRIFWAFVGLFFLTNWAYVLYAGMWDKPLAV